MTTESWRDRRVPRYEKNEKKNEMRLSTLAVFGIFLAITFYGAVIGGAVVWFWKDQIRAFFGW